MSKKAVLLGKKRIHEGDFQKPLFLWKF